MQPPKYLINSPLRYRWLVRGLICLLLRAVFCIGQVVAELGTTAPYSAKNQSISTLGITACGSFKEPQTQQQFYVCSPLYPVMDTTFVVSGLLIMLATTLAIRPLWPGKRLRALAVLLIFFGGIEEVVAGFSPLNLNPFLHSLSGGLAIAALNLGLILLGFAAIKKQPRLAWYTLFWGIVGMTGLLMSGTPPYVWLGYGGWERVAGYTFPLWGISVGAYWLNQIKDSKE